MASNAGKARASVARGWAFLVAVLMFALLGGAVSAAAADARPQARGIQAASLSTVGAIRPAAAPDPDKVKVTVTRAEYAEPADNPNAVSVDVKVRLMNGAVPPGNYSVFSQVFASVPTDGGAPVKSVPTACNQPHYTTNPEIDPGTYRCSYVVDRPDTWTFEVAVNKLGVAKLTRLASAQGTFPVSDAVKLGGLSQGLKYVVQGRTFEVFLLQAHMAAASIWLLMVIVMAFLAVPRLRRMCSTLTLHTLEVRRHFLNSVMWAMFLAVLGSGIYLLRTQTAYKAPWSKSAWDNITQLPYASTYFTTLYIKILIFVVMAAASVVLMMEAARQASIAGDATGGLSDSDDEFWGRLQFHDAAHDDGHGVADRRSDAGTTTAVASPKTRAATVRQGVSARTLWLCVFAVAGGMGAVGVCVTILKYTHELIEMLVAAKTVTGR